MLCVAVVNVFDDVFVDFDLGEILQEDGDLSPEAAKFFSSVHIDENGSLATTDKTI